MAVSKSQQKAVHKYVKANYDRMELTVPKGRKELIRAHAAAQGQSVNAYINTAIDEKMSREAAGSHTRPADVGEVSMDQEERDSSASSSTANELKIKMSPDEQKVVCGYAEVHGESVDDFVFRAIIELMKRDVAEMKSKTSQTDPEAEPATE